jgi:hypothetical protein
MSLSPDVQNLAAEIRRAYPTSPEAEATSLAIHLVDLGHVVVTRDGTRTYDRVARTKIPSIAGLPEGDSTSDRVERAIAREAMITGRMPAPPIAPQRRTVNVNVTAPPANASEADKIASAMQREDALRAALGLGADE